jgi:nucleotidyltransferase substrate binding protein (TIGR01987 family)
LDRDTKKGGGMKKVYDDKSKLHESIKELEHALSFIDKAQKDQFYFGGIAKSFEVCLEYAWKYMKKSAEDQGLEVFSPKDAIKMAGRLKLIDNVERWLDFLDDRNIAVHDYLGMSNEDYLKTIQDFSIEVKKL